MEQKEPKLKIVLEAESREYLFTAPLGIKVTYENISPVQLSLKDPNNVWETHLVTLYQGQENDEVFGKIEQTHPNAETSRYVEPEALVINIPVGGTYQFEADAAVRFYSLLHPGPMVIKIRDVSDDDLTLESNSVSITVRFKNESVGRLMAIVGDEMQPVEYRTWAAGWLKKVNEDFSPSFAYDEAPDDIKEKSRASINEALGKFRSWWVTFENSDASQRLLIEINDQYFIIPEEIPEEETDEDEL